MRKLAIIILSLLSISVIADIKPNYHIHGYFLQDSFRIGEEIKYCVTASYPKDQAAIFPDSSFRYFPLDYIRKIYFPTHSDSLYSTDSIIYYLSGFEIYNKQYLSIPILFVHNSDTIRKYTIRDSISLIHLVKTSSDHELRDQAFLTDVSEQFNYPYVLSEFVAIVLMLYVLYAIFGKIIVKRYSLFILRRSHNKFIKDFDKLTDRFNTDIDLRIIEQTLALWKSYLTRLEGKPINTYTTKELILLYDQEALEASLQSLDRNVYGGMITKDTSDALQVIKRFTNRRFQIRRREITGG